MIQLAEQLHHQLVEQLREADCQPAPSAIQQHDCLLRLISEAIGQLKQLVLRHTFPDTQEEIRFFKHCKPKFTSLLIYHTRLAQLDLKMPLGSRQDMLGHFEKELLLIRVFYEQHVSLYQYFLSQATFLDERLFVRGNQDLPSPYSTTSVDSDTRFTTHYDYLFGRFLANERLRQYLLQAIEDLERPAPAGPSAGQRAAISWTGSKVHLIELAYALYESGQINGGTTGVQEIAERLEDFFQVKLGGVYRTFQEMRQRKKDSRTKFLDLMKERLLCRMDTLDGS
ncbi:RteC domain-containing protein [Pontibacter indicus]|nr:RteC domain-containing protein [Pontibacter indicus]